MIAQAMQRSTELNVHHKVRFINNEFKIIQQIPNNIGIKQND